MADRAQVRIIRPRVNGEATSETDGWNFAFHVSHGGRGLANLYGGRRGLEAKLDEVFATPELADKLGTYGSVFHEMLEARAIRMGQYGFSNRRLTTSPTFRSLRTDICAGQRGLHHHPVHVVARGTLGASPLLEERLTN